jgi:hypothetical protein
MNVTSHLVVNSPPEQQGSVLGHDATEQSCLANLYILEAEVFLASVRADLAAQRAQKYRDYVAELHHVSEFAETPTPIDRADEPLFSKPRHLRLVAQFKAKITARFVLGKLDDSDREWAIGFASFFVRTLREIDRGMRGFNENDNLIIDRCFLKELRARTKTALRKVRTESRKRHYADLGFVSEFALTVRYLQLKKKTKRILDQNEVKELRSLNESDFLESIARHMGVSDTWHETTALPVGKKPAPLPLHDMLFHAKPETVASSNGTNPRKGETLEEYAGRNKNGELGRLLPYWCPTCKEYSASSHDGPGGIDCKVRLATIAEKRAVKLANQRKKKNRPTPRVSEKHLQPRGRGPTGINRQEDIMARKADAAFRRWLTESKMVKQRHPNAPPRVRSLEKIVSESK